MSDKVASTQVSELSNPGFGALSQAIQTDFPLWVSDKYVSATTSLSEVGQAVRSTFYHWLPEFLKPFDNDRKSQLSLKVKESAWYEKQWATVVPDAVYADISLVNMKMTVTPSSTGITFKPGINEDGVEILSSKLFELTSDNAKFGRLVGFQMNPINNQFIAVSDKGFAFSGMMNRETLEVENVKVAALVNSEKGLFYNGKPEKVQFDGVRGKTFYVQFSGDEVKTHAYSSETLELDGFIDKDTLGVGERIFVSNPGYWDSHYGALKEVFPHARDFSFLSDGFVVVLNENKEPKAGEHRYQILLADKNSQDYHEIFGFGDEKTDDFHSLNVLSRDEATGKLSIFLVSNNAQNEAAATRGLKLDIQIPWPTKTQKLKENVQNNPLAFAMLPVLALSLYDSYKNRKGNKSSEESSDETVQVETEVEVEDHLQAQEVELPESAVAVLPIEIDSDKSLTPSV